MIDIFRNTSPRLWLFLIAKAVSRASYALAQFRVFLAVVRPRTTVVPREHLMPRWWFVPAKRRSKMLVRQSSSIDSQPSPSVLAPPVSGSPSSDSESLLSFCTPTSLSLISPSTGATLSANARLTAGLVDVSYVLCQSSAWSE